MLALQAGEASLVLDPAQGGSILGWTRGVVPLLRHASPRAVIPGDTREMGAFPLVPYSNRIAGGFFHFDGVDYRLALNFGDHPNSIHGIGWQRAWEVVATASGAAALALHHTPDGDWPFAFTAEQHFHLGPDALHVSLTITNRHTTPAPAGLGLHPYFPRASMTVPRVNATLQFRANAVWRNGGDQLPVECVDVPPEWDHTSGRTVGELALDNCFEGWDGTAVLTWPDRRITIEADSTFRHTVVYTPRGESFFCVEPVSHMNDAINHGGMRVLDPGETLRGEIRFRLS
jgi:aldose 1-epimerase